MLILATLTLIIWLYLVFANGLFWVIDGFRTNNPLSVLPKVTVIIPSRDEAETIGLTIATLFNQNYPELKIVLVDDQSSDRTADIARTAAMEAGKGDQLTVIHGEPLPSGWSGKVWAMHQGVTRCLMGDEETEFILFSDADIVHGDGTIEELVTKCIATDADMASYMVRLNCTTTSEKFMIPAFVYFFRMLYPFRRVNNRSNRLAGAAGGTILVRRSALERIGGLESIKGELIDDCSLAAKVKAGGNSIWLGLSNKSSSSRVYHGLGEITDMIARTAFTQLKYSWLQVAISIVGLGITFIVPPLLAVYGRGPTQWFALFAWILMSVTYLPMVRFYRQNGLWALVLPLTSIVYLYATLVSAIRHARGTGGMWKGRTKSI